MRLLTAVGCKLGHHHHGLGNNVTHEPDDVGVCTPQLQLPQEFHLHPEFLSLGLLDRPWKQTQHGVTDQDKFDFDASWSGLVFFSF